LVALFEDARVAAEGGGVAGLRLRHQAVEKPTPALARTSDEGHLLGVEEHRPELARECLGADRLAVDGQRALGATRLAALQPDLEAALDILLGEVQLDARPLLVPHHHLGQDCRPRRAPGGAKVDRLQQVGLALRVGPQQEVDAGAQWHRLLEIVAKSEEADGGDHGPDPRRAGVATSPRGRA